MLEAQVRTGSGLLVKVTGPDQKSLFSAVASAQEVFGETHCGLCGDAAIRLKHRTSGKKGEFNYYEAVCTKCGARLSYSQSKDTVSLFACRKLLPSGKPDFAKGEFGPHNGWTKFRGDAADGE